MRRLLSLAFAIAALSGCATKYTTAGGNLRIAPTPEENYDRGMAELRDKHYPEALRFFEYVKSKYPFSEKSAQADLRIADIKLAQGLPAEAAAAFQAFVKDHPTSPDLDYARIQQAKALFQAAPGDMFLFPPSSEKDQRDSEDALKLVKEVMAKNPPSTQREEAVKLRAKIEDRLVRREWFVAEYYFKTKHWAGAAGRYQGLVNDYPSAPQVPEALLKLAQSYAKLDDKFLARQALQELIVHHADAPQRPEAEKLLESLR
jgi:outer membrane protein assembly factor BamD